MQGFFTRTTKCAIADFDVYSAKTAQQEVSGVIQLERTYLASKHKVRWSVILRLS